MREEFISRQADIVFGSGQFIRALFDTKPNPELAAQDSDTQVSNYDEFCRLNTVEQAELVGYANGCPVTGELTDPLHPDQENRGPENMLNRYSRLNFWFRQIVHTAEKLNPELAEQLQWSVERSEPAGENIEQGSVPDNFYSHMSPMGTLWGYAASRLLVKRLGSVNLPQYEARRRAHDTIRILNTAVSEARSREDLLAVIADEVARTGEVSQLEVLHEALSAGWYGEHHASGMVDNVKEALRTKAPDLWTYYEYLLLGEKKRAGVLGETAAFELEAGPVAIDALEPFHNDEFGYTLWEEVRDPANPDGPLGIIMHVPAGAMSKVWKLLENGYSESIEFVRGSGFISVNREDSEEWDTVPLHAENPTAGGIRINRGDMFSVVADDDGIVVFSRPSKDFNKAYEQDVTTSPRDAISRQVLASVSLARA